MGLASSLDVLLVDDSPLKNVINNPYNTVHPPTWNGSLEDNFMEQTLKPWLAALFASNVDVPIFVAQFPIPGRTPDLEQSNILAKAVNAAIPPTPLLV